MNSVQNMYYFSFSIEKCKVWVISPPELEIYNLVEAVKHSAINMLVLPGFKPSQIKIPSLTNVFLKAIIYSVQGSNVH